MLRSTSGRATQIAQAVVRIHGQNVMLDEDLARLYGVETKVLNQAVRRNRTRFPTDFMFQLTASEAAALRSHFVTLESARPDSPLRSQSVTSNARGGRRYLAYAFTEQGVAMLSSVLRSPRAIAVNIEIMRAFVQLRRMLDSNTELARRLAELERKYDGKFSVVFEAIRQLMAPPPARGKRIGFRREK
jgi:hypothetical protein